MNRTLRAVLATVLCYLMIISTLPLTLINASAYTGAGTENNPYIVSTAADLKTLLANYNTSDVYIRLKNNITLDSTYTPSSFAANLDGNFYKITASTPFCYTNSGTVRNLYFTNTVAVTDGYSVNAGAFCTENSGVISGVIVSGSVNCRCSHTSSGDGDSAPSVVGIITGRNTGTIVNCAAIGSVSCYCPYGGESGGIAYSSSGTIANCYVAGSVSASGSSRYGTSVEHPITISSYSNCYYNSDLEDSAQPGGYDTAFMKSSSFVDILNSGTVHTDSIWIRDTSNKNNGYPILKKALNAEITASKNNILLSGTEYISLTCSDPNAKIYYTVNETIPTASGYLYSSSIAVSRSTVITAIAYKDGIYSAPVRFPYAKITGDGTKSNPYVIDCEAALRAIPELSNSAYYVLGKNITMTDNFPCLGDFYGHFDGRGYILFDVFTSSLTSGLFKNNYGIIQNVSLSVKNGKEYKAGGGITSCNNGLIYNCHIAGNVNGASASRAGAIAASNYGKIEKCSYNGFLYVHNSDYVGGIVGFNKGSMAFCDFTGKLTVHTSSFSCKQGYVGGMVGYTDSNSALRYCTVDATSVTGGGLMYSGIYVGVLAGGWASSADVYGCTADVDYIYAEYHYLEWGQTEENYFVGTSSGVAAPTIHTHQYSFVTNAPDCDDNKRNTFSCTCGETFFYEFAGTYLGHKYGDFTYTVAIKPTCEQKGEERCYCTVCDVYLSREIAALGHKYTSEITKESTCSEYGIRTYTCSVCGYSYTTDVAKKSHTYTYVDTPATCTDSKKRVYTCSVCGYSYTSILSAALGHSWGDWVYLEEPDCLNGGVKQRVCQTDSNHIETVEVEARGHYLTSYNAKAATCTEIGWKSYVSCLNCDYTTYEEIEELGHDMHQYAGREATCTATGYDYYDACSRCDYIVYTGEVDPLGHDKISNEAKAATCTESGWNAYTSCSRCAYTTKTVIPALGHNLSSHSRKEPTCTEVGWNEYTDCSRCDYSTYQEIPAFGHINGEWQTVLQPTCTESGMKTCSCTRIEYALIEKTQNYPESSHPYANNSAQTYQYTVPGANKLNVVFSSLTEFENNYDKLTIYDKNNVQVGQYTGEELKGKAVTVPGDTLKISLSTDSSVTKHGFEIDSITPVFAETSHPYNDRMNESYSIAVEGADRLVIHFSEDTETEARYDFIGIYDNAGKLIGKYSGYQLADQTVTVPGDSCRITFTSDISNVAYGFAVDSVDAYRVLLQCDETTEEEIPAQGHSIVTHTAKAPDCTNVGWSEYETCSRCDYTTYEEIPALGHDEITHDAKSADCVDVGWDEYVTCSRCAYTTYEEIQALGHNRIHHSAQYATCENIGWKAYETCSRCSYTTYEELPALGHVPGEAVVSQEPDCVTPGILTSVCTVRLYDTRLISASSYPESAHNYSDNIDRTYVFTSEGAAQLDVKFNNSTKVEQNYDYLYIYDAADNEIGKYTGTQLAGKTVSIEGDTVKIRLTSDISVVSYGFKIDTIYAKEAYYTCNEVFESEIEALGHDVISYDAKTPSCTEIGWDAYVSCSRCDYTTYEESESLGHNEIYHDAKESSCTEIGWDSYIVCARCGYSTYSEIPVDAEAHKWDNGVVTTPATCKVSGVKTYTCEYDETHTYTEDLGLNASNHVNTINTEATDPTCSEAGFTEGVYCNDCQNFISGHDEIPVDAEAHKWDNGVVSIPATCKVNGIKTYVCQHNSAHKKTECFGLDKNNHVKTRNVSEITATCSTIGYTAGVYCDDCLKYISGHEEIGVDVNAHKWDGGEITTVATCKVSGVKTYTCEYDETHTYTEDLGLNASNHVNTINTEATAPDCSEVGYTEGVYCNDCQNFISGHEEIGVDVNAHKWDGGEITTVATCKVSGVKTYICQHNTVHKKTENLGFDESNHVNIRNVSGITATCSTIGYTAGVYCDDCLEFISGHEEIGVDVNAHKWDGGEITTVATCKVSGVKTYTCEYDETHTYTEDLGINASNHVNTINTEAIAPTCSEVGYTAGVFCNDCQKYISGHDEIPVDADAHKWDNGVVSTPATCKVSGVKTYVCQHNTAHKKTENLGLDESNHTNTRNVSGITATCSTIGYTAGVYCNDCLKYISGHKEIPVDVNAHKWDSGEITTVATCKVNGVKTYTCQHNSEHTYNESFGINPANHVNTKNVAAVNATCSTVGYTAGIYCNDCAKYISGHQVLATDTTAHSWDNGTVTTVAGCKVNGVKTYTCKHNAAHTRIEAIGIDTDNHKNTKSVAAVTATCSTIGYTAGVYCNDCLKYISGHKEIPVDADAHKWDNGAVTTVATCKVNGVRTYTCQHNSEHTYNESFGINPANHVNTKSVAAVNATCSTVGYTTGIYCNDCQKYISGHKEIPTDSSAHKWDSGKLTVTATCKVNGVRAYTCQHNSEHTYTESIGINAANHVNTKSVAAVNATCSTVGYTAGVYCNDCQKYISGHKEIPTDSSAHKWDSGKLTVTASCSVNGVKTYVCQNNSAHTYTEKLGLNAANHVNTLNVAEVKATCIAVGYTAGVYCNDCQKYISGHNETAKNPANHVNTRAVAEVPATTENAGYTAGVYCDDCKRYISGHAEIPKIEVSFTDSENAIASGEYILVNSGLTISELLAQAGNNAEIKDIAGNVLAADKLPGTGMTLTLVSGKKYTVILLGDVDCDGTVSASDARLALRAAVGLEQYGEDTYQHIAANVESNDNLSSSDARLILRAAVGLEKLYVLKKD